MAALIILSGGDDLYAKRKKRSRRSRTTKVRKASRTKKTKSSKPVVILGTTGSIDAPDPFVTLPFDGETPQEGLADRTIAVWPSHGKYFNGAWVWQRPRLFGTVEDLLSRSFVDPYIAPMLENAGAYVMMPRERDFSKSALIIDSDRSNHDGQFVTSTGKYKWEMEPDSTGYLLPDTPLVQGENPFLAGHSGKVKTVAPHDSVHASTAMWFGTPVESGDRAVYVSYKSYPNSATDAVYTVSHLGGESKVVVNQQMGGGTWVYLGTYPFGDASTSEPIVTLSNISADEDAVVSADAVKIGGGYGSVARSKNGGSPRVSGYPAYLEGARYYLQAAGFPEEVYSPNKGGNDYEDDYKSRALWVNHLAGGSELFPDTIGLSVPVDMVLALHTDAGRNDTLTIGTLGLYSTDDGNPLGNGSARYANRDLTSAVTSQVVNDIRAIYDPAWRSRGNLDRKYYEVRETKVPAMIIELLSHQNFEDMKHALDPQFRFIVGRAIYKGILRFLAQRYDKPYTVQPLPVDAFAIHADGNGYYTLTWHPVTDPLEPTAIPSYYIVYEATADRHYHPVATTTIPAWTTQINDDKIHAYYIVAGNKGGLSFPSEVLALYDNNHAYPSVEIVNGFTRVSAPHWVDGSDYAGFEFDREYGVPDGQDVHYIGHQFDFSPASKLGGGSFGFGESSDTEAADIRYGNSHDYTIIHGEAIRKAGRGFVSSSLKAFTSSTGTPKAVDLILGLQKATPQAGSDRIRFETLPATLRDRLTRYRNNGGRLLVSGSYLPSYILDSDSIKADSISRFAADILGFRPYLAEDTVIRLAPSTTSMKVTPAASLPGITPVRDLSLASFRTGEWVGAATPQPIAPASDRSLVIARYADTSLPAVIATEGDKSGVTAGRTVVASFPIEAVREDAPREGLIGTALQYLLGKEPDTPAAVDPQSPSDSTPASTDKHKQKSKKDKKKKDKKPAAVKTGKTKVPPPPAKKSKAPRPVPHRR